MDIRKVKGILIDRDGNEHSFGVQENELMDKLTDENYHDPAFKMDIVPTEWFKSLGYEYTDDTIHRQAMKLAGDYGIIFILNGCSINVNKSHYYLYIIMTPQDLSLKQKEKLENMYGDLSNIIDEEEAYFDGMAFKENGEDAWNFSEYNIDGFYNKMNLNTIKKENTSNMKF